MATERLTQIVPTERLRQIVPIITDRYEKHMRRAIYDLRASQQEAAYGLIDYFRQPKDNGEVRTGTGVTAPSASGKTVSGIFLVDAANTGPRGADLLGKPGGMRVLISVHTRQMAIQWYEELVGKIDTETGEITPGFFGDRFTPADVGIVKGTNAQRQLELKKPIVIMTHGLGRNLAYRRDKEGKPDPWLRGTDRELLIIDEIDEGPRGDVTKKYFQDILFPHCMTIGYTGTDIFRNGRTIWHYLFNEAEPAVRILHEEAQTRKEVAQHINIIVRPKIRAESDIKPDLNLWGDYTEKQKLRYVEQTGIDRAMVEVIKVGKHPKTAKPLIDMTQLHEGVNLAHCLRIKEMLDAEFGEGYSEIVSGKMDPKKEKEISHRLENGDLKAVVECKYWGRGTNIKSLESTYQRAPGLSARKILQFHARSTRFFNYEDGSEKVPLLVTPFLEGIDQLIVGMLLNSLYMIPDHLQKWEFAPTAGIHSSANEPKPWPVIEGVEVYYTLEHLMGFRAEYEKIRMRGGLPVKSKDQFSLEEMAERLNIPVEILKTCLYDPLQDEYEKRIARDKIIQVKVPKPGNDVVYVRSQRFPIRSIGHYRGRGGSAAFCIDKSALGLCQHALYGALDPVPPEMLNLRQLHIIFKNDAMKLNDLWEQLQLAVFERQSYQRNVEVDGVKISYNDFSFYKGANGPEFYVAPDILPAVYDIIPTTSPVEQKKREAALRMFKTSDWYTEEGVLQALELIPYGSEARAVRSRFAEINAESNTLKLGVENTVIIGQREKRHEVKVARKLLPSAIEQQDRICVSYKYCNHMREELKVLNQSAENVVQGSSILKHGPVEPLP